MPTVGEHIAIVQRAQAIAATDHTALVRAQRELALRLRELAKVRTEACTEIQRLHAELQGLRRRARRRSPAISGRRGGSGAGEGAGGKWSSSRWMCEPYNSGLGYCAG